MFSTMLKDFSQYAEIVFDCHPRLIGMFRRSFPFLAELYPTRKEERIDWPMHAEPCPFKCAIGDLGRLLRPDLKSFQSAAKRQSPWIKADPGLVDQYRKALEEIAPGKRYVGVAWTGGVIRTMRWYRSCQLPELYSLANDDTVMVSLQYEDDTISVAKAIEDTGRVMIRLPAITQHYDYDHTLALVMALDEVVTVCQSVAHLSAAAGQVTRVLVPDKPAWRYGLKGDDWFWYGENARLYRRRYASWQDAISRLEHDMGIPRGAAGEWRGSVLASLAKKHGLRSFVEVGCKEGKLSEFMCLFTSCDVVAIDPWENAPKNETETYEDWNWDAIKGEFRARTEPFGDRVRMIQDLSTNAAQKVEAADLIFIDAAHDYPNVRADIAAWLPKCTGILAGHDFNDRWPGVKRAVIEAFGDKVRVEKDSVWWVDVREVMEQAA